MPYIDTGYIAEDYYENDISTITPTENIIAINTNFVLDGVDIKKYVGDVSITRENKKAFSVLTMKLSGYDIPTTAIRNKDVRLIATIGLTQYSFIIIDADKDHKGNYDILAKTQGCLLDYPFSVSINESFIGNSNDIISELATDVSIYNGLPSFDFNEGSFVLDGSALEGVERLVDVSGGTFFEVDDKLVLTPHLHIETTTPKFILNDGILTSKVVSSNYSGSPLTKKVIFNVSETDLLSEPLITMVYDEDTCNRPYFLLNPVPYNIANITSNLGDMTLTFFEQTYTEAISDNTVTVSGGIVNIKQITLDGIPIDEATYEFVTGYNTILFTTPLNGIISVAYLTKAIYVYEKNGLFDFETRSVIYTMEYLTQKLDISINTCADVIDSNGLNSFSVELVGEKILMDAPTQFDVIGNVTNLAFISNPTALPSIVNSYYAYGSFNTSFMAGISIESGLLVDKTLTATFRNITNNLPNVNTEVFGFFTSPDIDISEVLIGSLSIAVIKNSRNPLYNIYYTSNDTFVGQSITATYKAVVDRYTIPTVGASNTVRYIDFYYEDGIASFSYPDINDGTYAGVCSLPAVILLDVATLLDMYPQTLTGQTITYMGIPHLILPNGKVTITAHTATKQVIDTGYLRKGSYITIDTTNAEV